MVQSDRQGITLTKTTQAVSAILIMWQWQHKWQEIKAKKF
jgi:hypothetical protein